MVHVTKLTNPNIHLFLHSTPASPSEDTRMAPAPAESIMRESTWYIPSPKSPDTTLLPYSASRVNTPTTKVVKEATYKAQIIFRTIVIVYTHPGLAGKYRWWELPVVFTGISRPGKYYQFPLKWEILGNTKIKFYFFSIYSM